MFFREKKNVEDHDHPMCASCNHSKQSRKPTESIRKVPVSSKVGSLKKEKLKEGDLVATDQFVFCQGGRLFTASGREREEDRFKGGTIFVDVATGKQFMKCQVSLGMEETLLGKASFERGLLCMEPRSSTA